MEAQYTTPPVPSSLKSPIMSHGFPGQYKPAPPFPVPVTTEKKSGDYLSKENEEKGFWGIKPKFTPEIENAIEAILNYRKQEFARKIDTGKGFSMRAFAFDEKDLKSLFQKNKEKALVHFITKNQPRYEQFLRIEIRTGLARLKAAGAIREIQRIWGR